MSNDVLTNKKQQKIKLKCWFSVGNTKKNNLKHFLDETDIFIYVCFIICVNIFLPCGRNVTLAKLLFWISKYREVG